MLFDISLTAWVFPGSSTISSSVSNGHLKPGPGSDTAKPTSGSRVSLAVRAYESFNHRVQSLGVRSPRRAWADADSMTCFMT